MLTVQFDPDRLKGPLGGMPPGHAYFCRYRSADYLIQLKGSLDWLILPCAHDMLGYVFQRKSVYLPAGLSGVRMRKKTEGQAADKKADCTDGAGTV